MKPLHFVLLGLTVTIAGKFVKSLLAGFGVSF
jgi:hypothetical protein